MADLGTYSPEEITILLAGVVPIEGYVDGTFITITKDIMPFTTGKTSDGKVARLYNRDQTYTIVINLHSAAESNDLLTKLWLIDETTQKGKFPLLVKDHSGSSLFFSTTSWIESIPSLDFGVGITERAWAIRSSQGVMNVGGNLDASSKIQDLVNVVLGAAPILEGFI